MLWDAHSIYSICLICTLSNNIFAVHENNTAQGQMIVHIHDLQVTTSIRTFTDLKASTGVILMFRIDQKSQKGEFVHRRGDKTFLKVSCLNIISHCLLCPIKGPLNVRKLFNG